MTRRLPFLVVFLVAFLLLFGTVSAQIGPCRDSNDCGSGYVCRNSSCVLPDAGTLGITSLSAAPSSGVAPLNGVRVTVSTSGLIEGQGVLITYRLDCTSDRTWEQESASFQTTYTFSTTCSYPSSGTYGALVRATQQGAGSDETAVTIQVRAPSPASTPAGGGSIRVENPLGSRQFSDVLVAIINWIFTIALAISPIMIIYAGFLFVTGGGNPEQITRGRNVLVWTFVGLVVIILSRGLIAILQGILGV